MPLPVPVPAVAATYWVSFYIVGILMVFNVFASFIIDIFLALYEDQGEPDMHLGCVFIEHRYT